MNFAPMVVNLLGFKVNVMDRASQLNFGPSQQVDTFRLGGKQECNVAIDLAFQHRKTPLSLPDLQ